MQGERPLIVCMDDSLMVHEMLRDGFEGTNYALELVRDVQELERRILTDPDLLSRVALFVFDFDMPEMTGTQIASVLGSAEKRLANIPFIIFSGRPRAEVLAAIEEAKAYSYNFVRNFRGYVEKEFDSIQTLLEKIAEVLSRPRPESGRKETPLVES